VRVTAVHALIKQPVRDAGLIPTLLPLLKDDSPELREATLDGITRIADRLTLYPRAVERAALPESIRTLQVALPQLEALRKMPVPPAPGVPGAITALHRAIESLQFARSHPGHGIIMDDR
jgi:hypothetical protein